MRGTVDDPRYDRVVDRRKKRRAFFFGAALCALLACGIERKGGHSDPDPIEGGLDGETIGDARAETEDDGAPDAIADAPFDCGEGGGFCDLCDETLLLCLPFDDEVKDKSRYAQPIMVLGSPGFVNGPMGHGRAMEIDAATTLRVAHSKAWEDYSELTMEVFIRPSVLPDGGGRSGLVDKNNSFGFFLQANGDLQCSAGAGIRGQPEGGLGDAGRYVHIACVGGKGKATLYARGVAFLEIDASSPSA